MNTEQTPLEVEVLPPSVISQLESASINSQVATARQFPRSLVQFKRRSLEMATLDEATAEACIYSRPVGDGKVVDGASIRLAEIVACCWGNIRVQARIIEQTDRFVKCEGTAMDLESNYAGKSEVIEPTVTKAGAPYSERQRAVVAKACLSKAYRDAVFKIVPRAMCKSIIDAAKKVAVGDEKTLDERRKKAKEWLKQIKVSETRAFTLLNVKGWEDVGLDQLVILTGVRTAINDGDSSPDDAFPLGISTPKMATAETPQTYAAGAGAVVSPAPKTMSDALILLLKNMNESDITEPQVLEHGRGLGIFDDSLSTLAEVADMQPDALTVVNSSWKSIAKKLKKQAA